MNETFQIVRVERGETKGSKSPMWRCWTDSGEQVNVFMHEMPERNTFRYLHDAGYGDDFCEMAVGETLTWYQHPITVQMRKDGQWWALTAALKRNPDAGPDAQYVPNLDFWRVYAQTVADNLLMSWVSDLVIFDLETTGLGWDDEIVQVTAINPWGEVLVDTLVQAQEPERLTRLHKNGHSASEFNGITPEMLVDAPEFGVVHGQLAPAMCDQILVAYNANFDVPKLQQACERHSLAPIFPAATVCVMELYSLYAGDWDPIRQNFRLHSLVDAAEAFEISTDGAHGALADARMTLAVLRAMAEGKDTVEEIAY